MLSVEESAANELKQIVRQSGCADPVLLLYESAEPTSAFDELKLLYFSGVDRKTMEDVGRRIYQENAEHLAHTLEVSVCERSDCRREDIVVINGFTFVMDRYIQDALNDCWIIANHGAFFLKDSECVFPDLRSAVIKHFKKSKGGGGNVQY